MPENLTQKNSHEILFLHRCNPPCPGRGTYRSCAVSARPKICAETAEPAAAH